MLIIFVIYKKIICKTFLALDSPNLNKFFVVAQYILPMLVWLPFAGPYVFIREQYSRKCYVTQQDKKYELRVHEYYSLSNDKLSSVLFACYERRYLERFMFAKYIHISVNT